jgi:hypothetical protein
MKCPMHRSVEMTEKREMVPFMHMAREDGEPRRQWRISCHCPVKGCIQVGLIKTEYIVSKNMTSMVNTHV